MDETARRLSEKGGAMPVLAHDRVVGGDAEPGRWLYVLHGIFGAGRNWSSIARRIVSARPDWGALLVDLRQHGASQGFPPPHTLTSAAADLAGLAEETEAPPHALLAHSFGGKVALAYAATAPADLEQLWIVDSTPSARAPGGSAWHMLQTVRSLPPTFPTRDTLIDALEREGVARPVAQWMATNLERTESGMRWRFEVDAMAALLRSFFQTDLWPVVEAPPDGLSVHFVKASESSVLGAEAVARLERAAQDKDVALHVVKGGHWLNADNPEALIELLVESLPRG
jgi:esterase